MQGHQITESDWAEAYSKSLRLAILEEGGSYEMWTYMFSNIIGWMLKESSVSKHDANEMANQFLMDVAIILDDAIHERFGE